MKETNVLTNFYKQMNGTAWELITDQTEENSSEQVNQIKILTSPVTPSLKKSSIEI